LSEEDREKLKALIKEKIDQLNKEIEVLKMCLEIISEKSVATQKKAMETTIEAKIPSPQPQKIETTERKLLSSINEGKENIANIYVEKEKIIIVPGRNVEVDINSRDFKDFFIKKVLLGLKKEKAAVTYEVKDSNGILKEVIIRNVSEEKDIRRIEGAVKWTFSRFLKTKP